MWVIYLLCAAWWAFMIYRLIRGGLRDTDGPNLGLAALICIMFFLGAAAKSYDDQYEVEAAE